MSRVGETCRQFFQQHLVCNVTMFQLKSSNIVRHVLNFPGIPECFCQICYRNDKERNRTFTLYSNVWTSAENPSTKMKSSTYCCFLR